MRQVIKVKCKDCNYCKKGWFKSSPELYVCIGVKHPFVVDDINVDCTEYKDVVKCPRCGKSHYKELYSVNTYVCSHNDGGLTSKSNNAIRKVCHCLNCLKEFSYTHKG